MRETCAPAQRPGPTIDGHTHIRRPDWARWRRDGLAALGVLSIWLAAFAADLLMSVSTGDRLPMTVIYGACGGLMLFGAKYGLSG